MDYPVKIDLHMHTNVSDGTDTPAQILEHVKKAGIEFFSVTDHDALKGCRIIRDMLGQGDPYFICGTELSCRDSEGQYHILGYHYNPSSPAMEALIEKGHSLRMRKVTDRLEFIKTEFGFAFPEEEITQLLSMDNPGKPHIGNLMVKYGYADTKEIAITQYINKLHVRGLYIRPEEAIQAILDGGGIPVLAHPSYGSGNQLILGDDMDRRIRKLIGFGLQGVEAFYSGFSDKLCSEILSLAEKYDLYVTAGSDYHGSNKLVRLGDVGPCSTIGLTKGLKRFIDDTLGR